MRRCDVDGRVYCEVACCGDSRRRPRYRGRLMVIPLLRQVPVPLQDPREWVASACPGGVADLLALFGFSLF